MSYSPDCDNEKERISQFFKRLRIKQTKDNEILSLLSQFFKDLRIRQSWTLSQMISHVISNLPRPLGKDDIKDVRNYFHCGTKRKLHLIQRYMELIVSNDIDIPNDTNNSPQKFEGLFDGIEVPIILRETCNVTQISTDNSAIKLVSEDKLNTSENILKVYKNGLCPHKNCIMCVNELKIIREQIDLLLKEYYSKFSFEYKIVVECSLNITS